MSDTERLEAAAAKLEQRANRALDHVARCKSCSQLADEDRAVAALLRLVPDHGRAPIFQAALAVAAAVLGVPASPKEQTDA